MKGSIYKRCSCPPAYSAKGDRLACKLRHGSWSYVADAGRDPASGKRRQLKRGGFATKGDAEAALAALVEQSGRGVVPARRRETFKTYAEAWLATRSRRVRANTATGYASALNHAYAAFGARPISEVTRGDVEQVAHGMADAGRAARTVSFTLFVIGSVFEDAAQDGLIIRNPAARVSASGRPPREMEAHRDSEWQRLREHLSSDRLYACWLLTLYGLRRSEVMGMAWSDIDLAAGMCTVVRGVVADVSGKRSAPTGTKTRRGTRTLPLPDDVLTELRTLRETQAADHGFEHVRTGYLAVDEAGQPYRPERWSDLWRAHCRTAGVRPLTLHAARHTSVTLMRAANVPDHVVAAWHGHDEVVMRRTYSHPDVAGLAAAGTALSGSRDQNVTRTGSQ